MSNIITLTCLVFLLAFPTLILCIVYPFSKKLSLILSNFITTYCDRVFFGILRIYKKFNLREYKDFRQELPQQFLVLSNHQSVLDICVFLHFFGGRKTRFVAKDALAKVPMVGKMLRSQFFAERVRKNGWYPVIFPEGTRSRDGSLGKFYSAGFRKLEEQLQLPVVVCALDGGWRISQIDTIFRRLYKGEYRIKILKICDAPKTKEEAMTLLDQAHELIEKQLEDWRSE